MSGHTHDGSAFRQWVGFHAHDGSAWRQAQTVYAHDGSAWRQVFNAFALIATPTGTIEYEGVTGGTAIATMQALITGLTAAHSGFMSGGGAYGTPTGGTNATGKYFKWTLSSGTVNYTNMTAGVWYPVGVGYYVGNRRVSSQGVTVGYANISFANDSGGSGATTPALWTFRSILSLS